jgi:hypothetical protein
MADWPPGIEVPRLKCGHQSEREGKSWKRLLRWELIWQSGCLRCIEEHTATINRIRGLLSEFGLVLPQKAIAVRRGLPPALEQLPALAVSHWPICMYTSRCSMNALETTSRRASGYPACRPIEPWDRAVAARVGYHKTIIAVAAKNARIAWALLTKDETLRLAA